MLQENPAKNVFRLAGQHVIRGRTRLPGPHRMCNTPRPCAGSVRPRLTHSSAFSLEFYCSIWVNVLGPAVLFQRAGDVRAGLRGGDHRRHPRHRRRGRHRTLPGRPVQASGPHGGGRGPDGDVPPLHRRGVLVQRIPADPRLSSRPDRHMGFLFRGGGLSGVPRGARRQKFVRQEIIERAWASSSSCFRCATSLPSSLEAHESSGDDSRPGRAPTPVLARRRPPHARGARGRVPPLS